MYHWEQCSGGNDATMSWTTNPKSVLLVVVVVAVVDETHHQQHHATTVIVDYELRWR